MYNIAFFQYCRRCAGRRRWQWRSRSGTNRRSDFTKEPEAAGQEAPAHTAPGPAAGQSGGSQPGEYTAASCTIRSLAPAACTAGWGFGWQWPPPTGDASGTNPGHVNRRVRQHSSRVAATMQPGGGYRGRPVDERPGKCSRHWLYCRRHCRPAALWCGAVGIGAGTFESAPGRAGITRTVYDIHHMRRRVVNQTLK
jgi:hypothetical protein